MEYKIFKQKDSQRLNYDFIQRVVEQFDLSYMSALLLNLKGIETIDEVETYLNPKIEDLYDPFLFKDMKKVMKTLKNVMLNNLKVIIFSDYDCDGVTSGFILYKVLKFMNIDVEVMIPNRFKNGYGLNTNSIDEIIEKKPSLVITTDNGISSVNEVKVLKDNGIDVIITDHHTPPEVLPKALAIINPKVKDDTYPFNELCGAGVAFKVACGIVEYFELDFDLKEVLIFAMIGTIVDIVSLKDENRTIASLGLRLIKDTQNKGLKALIKKSGYEVSDIGAGNISFQIGPRINVAGRLKDAMIAQRLFLSEDEEDAKTLAQELCDLNDERKGIENEIFSKSEKIIQENNLVENYPILYILSSDFNEGVMGIAASKICEKYNRPVVIMTKSEDGLIKASCRSITGFNIFECLNSKRELFVKFGGHSAAAGFSIERENLDELIKDTCVYAKEHKIENLFYKRVYYDALAIPSNLNISSAMELEKFAPFGVGNARSVLCLRNVVINNTRKIGYDKSHLKLSVLYNGNYYDAIGFSMGDCLDEYDFTKTFDIVFNLSINSYRGVDKVQFELKDIDQHNVDLKNFDKAEYLYFKYSLENKKYFYPTKDPIYDSFESIVCSNKDKVLVLYDKDTFIRVVNFLKYKNYPYSISYNVLKRKEGKVNILCMPTQPILQEAVILDRPIFNDFEEEIYKNTQYDYIKSPIKKNNVRITRTFFLYLYKKFKLLLLTDNNIYEFIDNIRNESDIELNYFTVRLALDIMEEMKILNYSIKNDKLCLSFNKIESKKDINKTKIMEKLNFRQGL